MSPPSAADPLRPPLRVFFGTISPAMPGGIYGTETPFQDACAASGEVIVKTLSFGRRRPDESRLGRSLRRLADWVAYVSIVLRERPDLVHLNTAFDRRALVRDVGYATLSRLLGQRLFLKLHGSDAAALAAPSRFWRAMTRRTLAGASGVGVLSSEEKRNFVAAGFPADRFHVVKNAVDSAPFADATWPRPGPPRLLFIARLIESKGVFEVIRALRILRDAGRDVHLSCVGDGPVRPSAQALARELGLGDAVTFPGFVPAGEAARYYREAWMLVFPTRHGEGFSMSIFQSVAAGLPILTTRIRAAADHLREPENVLWVEPSDPEGLASKVAWLLDRPDVMAAMSRSNRALAGAFGPDAVAREYIALYRRLRAEPVRSGSHWRHPHGATAARDEADGGRIVEKAP